MPQVTLFKRYTRRKGKRRIISYYAKWRDPIDGHEIRKSLRTTNKTLAEKRRTAIQYELDNPPDPDEYTIEQVLAERTEYGKNRNAPATLIGYKNAVQCLRVSVSAPRFSDITRRDMIEWQNEALEENMSPHTVNGYLISLRALHNWAVKHDYVTGRNPFKYVDQIKTPKNRQYWISDSADQDRLLEFAEMHSPDMHCFIALGLYAGMRHREIMYQRWQDIDFENGFIRIRHHGTFVRKNGVEHDVPMSSNLRGVLAKYRKNDGYICWPEKPDDGRYRKNIHGAFKAVCKAAGLEDCKIHTLRYTAAGRWRTGGNSSDQIAEWLGNTPSVAEQNYGYIRAGSGNIDV